MKRLEKIMVALLACLTVGVSAVGLSSCKEDEASVSDSSSSETVSSETSENNSSENEKPHTHVWDDGAITTEAICETDGVKTFTCACGETYTETVPATGHNYTEKVTAPTCTEQGYTTYTCACGDTYVDNEVVATGHNHAEKVTAPTCTEQGYTTYTCTCGETYTETIPATGHNYTKKVTAPTCTEQGYTTYTCACGDTYVGNKVKATGHDYAEEVTAPTCTEQGYTTYTCTCGDTYVGNKVKAEGHTEVIDEAVAPTCTATGLTEGKHCSACGATLLAQESVAMTGHNYVKGVCDACDDLQTKGLQYSKSYSYSEDSYFYSVTGLGTCADTDIVIPFKYDGLSVTSISSSAFEGCSGLTSVTIPDSVTSIGDGAFDECSGLTGVYITDIAKWCNISFAGSKANPLSYAKNLYLNNELVTDLVIPDSVTEIYYYAFYGCSSVTSVTIPDSVTSIGMKAFYECSDLANVVIPDSVTEIYSYAFYGTAYYNDESNWENDVLYIDKWLIKAKTGIVGDYTIKDGTLRIANLAFEECSNLTSVVISDGVTSIGGGAFQYCSGLTSVYITDIAKWCNISFCPDDNIWYYNYSTNPLYYAKKLYLNNELVTDLVIPDTVTEIKSCAFYSYSSLTSVEIPDSVTSIGKYAFNNCSSLTSVKISDSVTSIKEDAFRNCSSLTSITVDENNTAYQSIDGNLYTKDGTILLQYAIGKTDKTFIIPDGVTTIADYAFSGCKDLTSVVITNSVTEFNPEAFRNVPLENVYFEEVAFDSFIDILEASELDDWLGYRRVNTFMCARWYRYSEEEPTAVGLWWHYVDGVPTVW